MRWGHHTHSCSESCLCGNGLGPDYCTFCRLSPIYGHFLDLFFVPKLSAQISPATLTTFVPVMSLCGLKKTQGRGEDERTSLGKMLPRPPPHAARGLSLPFPRRAPGRPASHAGAVPGSLKKISFSNEHMGENILPLEPGPAPQRRGRVTEPHSVPSAPQLPRPRAAGALPRLRCAS